MLTQKPISGVYKITNTVTNEVYVGCSTNIRQRWYHHRSNYKMKGYKEYGKKLYRSMREYGLENFKFEILEEAEPSVIFDRERYYIRKLDTEVHGLNDTARHDSHGRARLSMADVVDIRERYAEHESKRNVYLDYKGKVGERGFHKVWNGYTWTDVMPEVYTKENVDFHKHDTGSSFETNARAKLTNEDVCEIYKMREQGIKRTVAYEKFKDKVTFGSFENVWYKCNWKGIA